MSLNAAGPYYWVRLLAPASVLLPWFIIQRAYGFVRGKKSLDGRALKSVSAIHIGRGHDVARTVGWAVD